MIDNAGYLMSGGNDVALGRAVGVNDNMASSHSHHYFEIYYLKGGQRYHVVEDRLHLINSGELIVFPPYRMHHSFGDEGVAFDRTVLYFRPEVVATDEILERIGKQTNTYRFDGVQLRHVDSIFERMERVQECADEFAGEEMRLLVNDLLISIVRQAPTDTEVERRDRITGVIRFLHEHHSEHLRLNDIASEFFVSQYHLCREFKKATKSTVMQYLTNVRIGQAQRLLDETELSVTEISERVGFANVTHFNRVFKQLTDMAPREYRSANARSRVAAR